ncbi:MAG: TldD/PmbA family protein [Theionarchaea archaeon]|nr:TldD/PmbA family protein [Theionarchaea archaeon]
MRRTEAEEEEYLSLCEYAVSHGDKMGADESEVMIVRKRSTSVTAELGELSTVSSITWEGLRLRVIKDKAMASVFTHAVNRSSIGEAIGRAIKAAQCSWKDPHWSSLPSPGRYPSLRLWDETLAQITPHMLIEPVTDMLKAAPPPLILHRIAHEASTRERMCVNSNDIYHADRGTHENVTIRALIKNQKEGVSSTFHLASYQRKYDPPYHLIQEMKEKSSLFNAKTQAHSGTATVILSPLTILKLFHYALLGALSGDSIARDGSFFTDKVDERVANSQVSLHDNGIIEEGTASQEMDDEGVPSQDTVLIRDGILTGFLWDDYWASRMKKQSTGNALYNDRTGRMGICHTNLEVECGTYSWEELLEGKEGYFICDIKGAHSSNPDTGAFTVTASPAFRVLQGCISGYITGMMISDSIFSLIQKIDAVGKDREVRQDAILPYIRCENVNIIAP